MLLRVMIVRMFRFMMCGCLNEWVFVRTKRRNHAKMTWEWPFDDNGVILRTAKLAALD